MVKPDDELQGGCMNDIIRATPVILAQANAADAIRQIIRECTNHVSGNIGMVNGFAEAAHQARVGLRRLRSALILFRKQLDKDTRKHLSNEVRKLGNALGSVRDWDVFLDETLPKMMRQVNGVHIPFDDVRIAAANQRLNAGQALKDAYQDIEVVWFALADRANNIALRGGEGGDLIIDMAPELLAPQARLVNKFSRQLQTPEQRHALRKAVKKLRYSVEFLGSLYNPKAVRHYLDRCKAAQEVLGDMNDASTTRHLCETLQMKELPMEPLIDWARVREVRAEGHLADTVTAFRDGKPFWY